MSLSRRAFVGSLVTASFLSLGAGRLMAAPGTVSATGAASKDLSLGLGTCAHFDLLNSDARLRDTILDNYTSVTPEYSLQWSSFEPVPGRFHFAPNDGLVEFASEKGLAVNGHALLWEQGTPGWGTPPWVIARLADKKPEWKLVENRFETVLGRYASRIHVWNVVNEPIEPAHGPDGMRRNAFYRAFGPSYIERALRCAGELAPEAKLMLNEYSLEYQNPTDRARRLAVLRMIESLRKRDVPLHQFGIQGHLDLRKGSLDAKGLTVFLRELVDFGLEVQITELDVQEGDLSGSLKQRDERVADEVGSFLEIVLENPAVTRMTTWGVSDKQSWLNNQADILRIGRRSDEPANRGLPFDADYRPKRMAATLADALVDRTATASLGKSVGR